MKRLLTLVLALLLGALALTGCGPSTATPAPTAQPAATAKSATAAPAATKQPAQATQAPAKAASPAPTTAASEDTLSLDSRDAALDKLKSYRMRWQAQWKSTAVTDTTTSGWDWTEEYVKDPPALHWNWNITGGESGVPTAMEAWQIGDTMYMILDAKQGAAGCISISSQDQSTQLSKGLFSATSLGKVSGAKFVGAETVNGVKSKHYKYDEKTAFLASFNKVTGDIYVAVDGGYVVKDVMQWKGGGGLFGGDANATGDGQWSWELSNVDQPLTITPPADCGGAAVGLPMLPDATGKSSFGTMTTYTSATALADAVAFYKKEMPAAGWKLVEEPVATEALRMMTFSKEKQQAQVTITADAGKTSVLINISEE